MKSILRLEISVKSPWMATLLNLVSLKPIEKAFMLSVKFGVSYKIRAFVGNANSVSAM